MKKILEVANMKISINIDEKEKSIHTIINQVMSELEGKTKSSTLSQLKDVLLGKPFSAVAMAGLTAVVVLTPAATTGTAGLNPTNPGSGNIQTPETPGDAPTNPDTPANPGGGSVIGGSTASVEFNSYTTSATFKLRDEFIPSEINDINLYNNDQFVKTLSISDITDGDTLTIGGLAPNTTYEDFYLERAENDVPSLFFKVTFSEDSASIEMDKRLPLSTITTESDTELEKALEEALERNENGEHVSNGQEFVEGNIYLQGDKVLFDGNEYEAMWWTSEQPSDTNLAWKLISVQTGISGHEVYNDTAIYEEGHIVEVQTGDGQADVYKASHWIRGIEPGMSNTSWEYIETVDSSGNTSTVREWNEDTVYVGGTIIELNGKTYSANWWNLGENPETSAAWTYMPTEDSDEDTIIEWNENTVYVGGSIVKFEGNSYTAKWWTKGDIPTQSDVWVLVQDETEDSEGDVDIVNEWSATKTYNGGDQVTFNGITFEAKYNTTGDKPGSSTPWKIVYSNGVIYEWMQFYTYETGEKVTYEGKTYTANWNTSGEAPSNSSAWTVEA